MQLIWLQICLNSFQLYISQLGNVALDTNCIIGLIWVTQIEGTVHLVWLLVSFKWLYTIAALELNLTLSFIEFSSK